MKRRVETLRVTVLKAERIRTAKSGVLQFYGLDARLTSNLPLYRSGLERDFYMLATKHLGVREVEYEKLKISYKDESGKERTYRPDYSILFESPAKCPNWLNKAHNRRVLYEIKPEARFRNASTATRRAIMSGAIYAAEAGVGFQIAFDTEIRTAKLATARNWFDRTLRWRAYEYGFGPALDSLSKLEEPSLADLMRIFQLRPDKYAQHLCAYAFLRDLFRNDKIEGGSNE